MKDCAAALESVKAAGARLIDEVPRPGSRGTTVAFVHPKGAFGTLIDRAGVRQPLRPPLLASGPMDHPMTQRLADLKSRKEEALHAGPPHTVERQHSKGKMTARSASITCSTRARSRSSTCSPGTGRTAWARGEPTLYRRRDHRLRHDRQAEGLRLHQDFTVFGGALGEVFAEKIHKVMDLRASPSVSR